MIIDHGKYESRKLLIFKTFVEDFIAGVSHRASSLGLRLEEKCLKTYPENVALLTDNFLLESILRGSFPH